MLNFLVFIVILVLMSAAARRMTLRWHVDAPEAAVLYIVCIVVGILIADFLASFMASFYHGFIYGFNHPAIVWGRSS